MSATRSTADRGLRAVARVRGVREHDSRLGLQMALVEQQALEERATSVAERLASLPGDGARTPAELLTFRNGVAALGLHYREAFEEAISHEIVVEGARAQWHSDKTQLSAVENLLARRAERRRVERNKAEAKELDDLASVRWARDAAAIKAAAARATAGAR
ncbi:flagellar FliJ family protein [Nocardioides nematodiphilus]|uniref:flagellar FliJ family protein n=1 Tax=Nocardioides nematodiphilus TaxID=2849669 RepID=UPI001CD9D4B7|nr:flagellar FliJ family protein [Nocardioides nematodiphilus]MCA1984271.1 flagellar FliJ family protein [Nocardioides nematodiphilus]